MKFGHDNDRGGLGKGLAIGLLTVFAFVVLTFVACDTIFDDESEERRDGDDLGAPALVVARDRDGDRDQGRDSRGKCEGAERCEDQDFSPTLTDSPVIICLPSSRCDFGDGQQAYAPASLVPPNPEALIQGIRTFTAGVGEAAGALAGAIAAGTIGILLTT